MNVRRGIGFIAAVVALVGGGVAGASPAHAAVSDGQATARSFAAGDYHEIVNTATDKCVDVVRGSTAVGALVHQWGCAHDSSQLWASNDVGNGFVQFSNRNSGKCMSIVLGTLLVNQQPCNATDQRQWWSWQPADVFGNLVLQDAAQGGPCLALRPFSHNDGTRIGLADCATTDSQIWHSE
jgi:hypothetical protein